MISAFFSVEFCYLQMAEIMAKYKTAQGWVFFPLKVKSKFYCMVQIIQCALHLETEDMPFFKSEKHLFLKHS